MRKTKPMRIGELWDDFVSSSPVVQRRLAEARVTELWPAVVGPAVAAHTVSVKVEKGILTAVMSSSVARHELFMRRTALGEAVNQALGMRVVNTVIVK